MKPASRSLFSRARNFWRSQVQSARATAAKRDALRDVPDSAVTAGPETWPQSLQDPTAFYLRCLRQFHHHLPAELRAHRDYFSRERRGFGEDAFHVMWEQLFAMLRPGSYLEIGVYRGQTLSLAGLLAKRAGYTCATFGISPFSPVGDSVSTYAGVVEYQRDTLKNYERFASPPPVLLKAFSTDPEALQLIASRPWDLVYIDGNHDYEVALQDWRNCLQAVRPGGVIVLDDSGLTTGFRPPAFATGGHPGPSRLAREIRENDEAEEILQVGHNRVFRKRP